jgi:tetratricopeptide (TPR) repeat protein
MIKNRFIKLLVLGLFGLFSLQVFAASKKTKRKKSRAVVIKKNELKKAKLFLEEEEYVKAISLFYKIKKYSKSTSEKRAAEYYLGLSLFDMDLNYTASKYFTTIVRRGTSNNKYFKKSFDKIIEIHYQSSLDDAHISQLFSKNLDANLLSESSKSFYNFQKAIDLFYQSQTEEDSSLMAKSLDTFRKVNKKGNYYAKANFYMGVINALNYNNIKAIGFFKKAVQASKGLSNHYWILEQSYMNLGRIYYQMESYSDAIRNYSKIPRGSENWLEANFEAAWSFYLMDKINNSLGNVHTILSPFFEERFFPEAHILQAVSYINLCHYDKTKESLDYFKKVYKVVLKDMNKLLSLGKKNPVNFFKVIYKSRLKAIPSYGKALKIMTALRNTDDYRKVGLTIRQSNSEIKNISEEFSSKRYSRMKSEFISFLKKKKSLSISEAGKRLYLVAKSYKDSIIDLFDQTALIEAELQIGEVNVLRDKSEGKKEDVKSVFIGGMQELKIGERLEYWPVEPVVMTSDFVKKYEWWEDELGGYIYNVTNKCSS